MTSTMKDWVSAASAAVVDVAAQALGWESSVESLEGTAFRAPFGAYVPLSSSDSVVQLGIVAERLHCEAMSRALLGMPEDEAFGSDGDVADALGEIANMVAGSAKTRMNERIPDIVLGLPLCVNGRIECQGAEQATTEFTFGTTRARLVVLRAPRGSKPPTRPGR
jgi:hypothetical protein